MPTASSLLKDFSPKSQDAAALQQHCRAWRSPMIDRGDIRQAIDRCSNIWLHRRALVMVSSSIRLDSPIAKSKKRAERSERLMYEQSHRDYLRSGYLHHRLPVMAVNHYRDNAITYKAQRDKNARELKLANAAITDMQMRHVMLLRSMCKIHEELADAKAENDVCVMMLPLVVVCCTSAVYQSVREANYRLRRG